VSGLALSVGARLRSAVDDDTEVVVVRCPPHPVDLRCGGHRMRLGDADPGSEAMIAGFDGGSVIGKRYVADDVGLELLCVRPGRGTLSVGQSPLTLKAAKSLPASD
jgi:hypothetical protein